MNGSWLNMSEMALSLLSRQRLGVHRFETKGEMEAAVGSWANARNAGRAGTRWRFTTADARVKLHAVYPLPDTDR